MFSCDIAYSREPGGFEGLRDLYRTHANDLAVAEGQQVCDGSFNLDPASRADPSKSHKHQHSIDANGSEGLGLDASRATPRLCIEEFAQGGDAHDGTVGVGGSEIHSPQD